MMGMPSSRSDCRFSSSSMTPVNNTAAGRSAQRGDHAGLLGVGVRGLSHHQLIALRFQHLGAALHGQRELLAENVGDEGGHHAGLARAQRPRVRVGGVAGLRHHLQNAFALVLGDLLGLAQRARHRDRRHARQPGHFLDARRLGRRQRAAPAAARRGAGAGRRRGWGRRRRVPVAHAGGSRVGRGRSQAAARISACSTGRATWIRQSPASLSVCSRRDMTIPDTPKRRASSGASRRFKS